MKPHRMFARLRLRIAAFCLVSLLFVALMPSLCAGQKPEPASDWEKTCEVAKQTPIPEPDRPNPAERKELEGCVSDDLYYGTVRKSDPVKARLCAYLELEKERHSMDDRVFGREAMLMMIYANGDGATRNFDLALKFACELADYASGPEMKGRVEHLEKLKREPWTGHDFDLCDDAQSSFMLGECVARDEQSDALERPKKIAALASHWSDAQRMALQRLQQAANEFFSSRAENELDLSGNGATLAYVSEIHSLNDALVENLEKFEKGKLPRFSAKEFVSADRELNSVYSALAKVGDLDQGSVTMVGIRKTERAWIRYRDAWVAFGQIRYPAMSAESWKTWLTLERTKMLRELQ